MKARIRSQLGWTPSSISSSTNMGKMWRPSAILQANLSRKALEAMIRRKLFTYHTKRRTTSVIHRSWRKTSANFSLQNISKSSSKICSTSAPNKLWRLGWNPFEIYCTILHYWSLMWWCIRSNSKKGKRSWLTSSSLRLRLISHKQSRNSSYSFV